MKEMNILILEDEEKEIRKFTSYIDTVNTVNLVAAVSSIKEALQYLKNSEIEGVVVDIELNKGEGGSGLDFLKELNKMELAFRPLIIVTTRNESVAVQNACRAEKIDMIYYKSKEDYSPNIIINQFLNLRPYMNRTKQKSSISKVESEKELLFRVKELIQEELNLIGIPPNMKGYRYLEDAILYTLQNKDKDNCYYTNYLTEKYNIRKGGISTSIQDAINNAWRNTPEEDILDNFTANITYSKGAPTPIQFIHYYVEKVSRRI